MRCYGVTLQILEFFFVFGDGLSGVVGEYCQSDKGNDEQTHLDRRHDWVELEHREDCEQDDEKHDDSKRDDIDREIKHRFPVENTRFHDNG